MQLSFKISSRREVGGAAPGGEKQKAGNAGRKSMKYENSPGGNQETSPKSRRKAPNKLTTKSQKTPPKSRKRRRNAPAGKSRKQNVEDTAENGPKHLPKHLQTPPPKSRKTPHFYCFFRRCYTAILEEL